MDDYDFEERRYKNRKDDLEYEDYKKMNDESRVGIAYINNRRYHGNEEEIYEPAEDDYSEVKVKNKRNPNILMIIQIISCIIITLGALLLKYFGGTYYDIFYQWYKNEMDKSIIAGENLEKYISTFNFSLNKEQETFNVITKNINGEKKNVDFKILNPIENGVITSQFGESRENNKHKGIDIAAPENSVIVSVLKGVVSQISEDSSYGKYVVIDHGNSVKTKYAHCNQILTVDGSEVSQGSNIALVGSTGDSTGNHLHLELILDGVYYDPEPLFQYEYSVC